ncbi:MAG: molybdenum cofactor biosynthesis protein MoaE [Gemmatimonadetes bacterium]|nr:molybdenum cofactor biosynthesis protein MoaE [Gemmatimonadota bacterium]
MRITVRLFAGVRERVGAGVMALSLPDGATVEEAVAAALEDVEGGESLPSRLLTAVNEEYVRRDTVLRDGDELALIPPVSGGGPGTVSHGSAGVVITEGVLDPAPVVERVRSDRDGCVVTFVGVTRDHSEGRRVRYLEYEAYRPMAERKIAGIIEEMKARWEIGSVAVAHRLGRVEVGEASLVVAVSAPHRGPAFEAVAYFVDELKRVVPIWKKEYFEGGQLWIGDERR